MKQKVANGDVIYASVLLEIISDNQSKRVYSSAYYIKGYYFVCYYYFSIKGI